MKTENLLRDIFAGIGAAVIGAGAGWVGNKIYKKLKKKYATLELTEARKEEEDP